MHTPSPWFVAKAATPAYAPEFIIYCEANDYTIARVVNESSEDNARLIAAAPDLLDALYTALSFVEDAETDTTYKRLAVRKAVRTIKDAIAKATQE